MDAAQAQGIDWKMINKKLWKREEIIGDCRLLLGDCLEIMPHLDKVDAVVTDPPYGIGEARKASVRTRLAKGDARWRGRHRTDYAPSDWDDGCITKDHLDYIMSTSKWHIIWGGNYYALGPASKWLVWDKKTAGADFADCELAWTSLPGAVRKFDWLWSGFRKQEPEERFHPTQKPVAVMEWCFSFLPDAQTILDPFMGSGTTLVACAKLGKRGIGIELDPGYFDIACERIRKAYAQPDMFIEQAKAENPTQAVLFTD